MNKNVLVSLGDMWVDSCCICKERSYFGIASKNGPEGCKEAVESGQTYCDIHIPNLKLIGFSMASIAKIANEK